MVLDKFGFLFFDDQLSFHGFLIKPVDNYKELAKEVEEYVNQDGFIYPPMSHKIKLEAISGRVVEEITKTYRPAVFYQLPASHEIILKNSKNKNITREGLLGLILHSLAYMFGTRLQFHDWWFDSRIPVKVTTHNINFDKNDLEHFLDHTLNKWKSWDSKNQKLFITILYMLSKSACYEWDWERFAIEYMIVDACFRLSQNLGLLQLGEKIPHSKRRKKLCKTRIRHSERIKKLCEDFKIPHDETYINDIVDIRNDLFHEITWGNGLPGSAGSSKTYKMGDDLHRLNQRLILAMLEYKTNYIHTKWWSITQFKFKS